MNIELGCTNNSIVKEIIDFEATTYDSFDSELEKMFYSAAEQEVSQESKCSLSPNYNLKDLNISPLHRVHGSH